VDSAQSKIFNGVQVSAFFGVALLAGVKYSNWSGALLTATVGSGALLLTTPQNETKLPRFLRTVCWIAFGSLITHLSSKLLKGKVTSKLSENLSALALNTALAAGTTLLLKANKKQLPPPPPPSDDEASTTSETRTEESWARDFDAAAEEDISSASDAEDSSPPPSPTDEISPSHLFTEEEEEPMLDNEQSQLTSEDISEALDADNAALAELEKRIAEREEEKDEVRASEVRAFEPIQDEASDSHNAALAELDNENSDPLEVQPMGLAEQKAEVEKLHQWYLENPDERENFWERDGAQKLLKQFIQADLPYIPDIDLLTYQFVQKFLEENESLKTNQLDWILNARQFYGAFGTAKALFNLNFSLLQHKRPMNWFVDCTALGTNFVECRITDPIFEFAKGNPKHEQMLRDCLSSDLIIYAAKKREIPDWFKYSPSEQSLEDYLKESDLKKLNGWHLIHLTHLVDLNLLSLESQVELIELWAALDDSQDCKEKVFNSLTLDHFDKSSKLLDFYVSTSENNPKVFFKHVDEAKIKLFNDVKPGNRKIRYLKDYLPKEIVKLSYVQYHYWYSLNLSLDELGLKMKQKVAWDKLTHRHTGSIR